MEPFDLVIANGQIVTAADTYTADIGVRGEKIACIGRGLRGRRTIDASGCLVIPGAVDVHVHLQMPLGDITSSDDWRSGTMAAAHGGTTSIVDFVDPLPGQPPLQALEERLAEAEGQACIDYGLHMVLSDVSGKTLAQLSRMIDVGIPTFKLFMAYEGKCLTDDQLYLALREIARLGALALIHAENYPIIRLFVRELLAEGKTEPRWHPRSRPAIMEGEATGRLIALAEMAGAHACIAHISCAAVVCQIRAARARGLPIYGETCPQYLVLTQDVYERPDFEGARYVCSPPLRAEEDQAALWKALADGTLQVISTDHCPWWWQDKERGRGDFSRIPGGVPGIETRLSLTYHFGVRAGRLTPQQWVNLCCTRPAELFGLPGKGKIQVGADADIVIFDPERVMPLTAERLHSQVDYSIYEDITVRGWPRATISRGRVLVEDGRFIGLVGHGRFIRRRLV
ncbi:MAG TPA: dihydropyrimidinase [Caldilineae bacterium]|nr:dihydropyrimidinase [Caldilineae bacterium]